MKQFIVRSLSFVLLIIMLLTAVSCAQQEESTSSEAVSSDVSTEVSKEEEFVLFSNLPEKDYSGKVIRVLVEGDYMTSYKSVELLPHEESYDALNTAITNRNNLVTERFGVTFEQDRTSSTPEMANTLRENAVSGISTYDFVMPYLPVAASIAQEGYLLDLAQMENIHLDQPYYDQGSVKGLSIGGKNYFVTGDLSLLTYDVTHVLLFNKDMIKDNNLENPYDLVTSGKWTLDKLREMAQKITGDTDGESGMTHKDTYGFLVNNNFISSMFIGCGLRFSGKDQNDEPVLTIYSEQATTAYNKIFDLVNDETACGQIDNLSKGFGSSAVADGLTVWEGATEAIASKRALFRAVSLNAILVLGEYDCNFGVLPAPKFDEAQDDYYVRVSTLYASSVAIPNNAADPEMSSIIIDALMQSSTDTVKEAYIEVVMKERKIQDDESEAMLDLIFDSRVYDYGTVYNWGGASEGDANSITGFMNNIAFSGTNTFVSRWQAIEPSVQAAMDDTIATYRAID